MAVLLVLQRAVVHRRSLRALIPLLLLGALAGCNEDGSEPPSPPQPRSADATRACDTHIEGKLPAADPSEDFYVGPVRFRGFHPTSRFAAREGTAYFRRRQGEYAGLKFVTEVRAGADVTVAIAPENLKTAGMLYGLDEIDYGRFGIPFDEGEQTVRFKACAAGKRRFSGKGTVGPWTQFNGGFILTRPQCLRLDVYVRGRPARRYAAPFGYPSRSSSASSCRRSSSGRLSPKRA